MTEARLRGIAPVPRDVADRVFWWELVSGSASPLCPRGAPMPWPVRMAGDICASGGIEEDRPRPPGLHCP
jgi:hypothetical protein